jgi:hypothetical protein
LQFSTRVAWILALHGGFVLMNGRSDVLELDALVILSDGRFASVSGRWGDEGRDYQVASRIESTIAAAVSECQSYLDDGGRLIVENTMPLIDLGRYLMPGISQATASVHRRCAADGIAYTRAEFMEYYTFGQADEENELADMDRRDWYGITAPSDNLQGDAFADIVRRHAFSSAQSSRR